MKRTIVIELALPPAGSSQNGSHGHWSSKSKPRKEYRRDASVLGQKAKPADHVPFPVRVHHVWYMGPSPLEGALKGLKGLPRPKAKPVHYRPKDVQNAITALKGAIDGFVDAGIVPDDNASWVQWGDCKLLRKPEEHGGRSCVLITLEEIDSMEGSQGG